MNANQILLQKKYARVVKRFAEMTHLPLDTALSIFYHSEVYRLMREGVSDFDCMSDEYIAEDLKAEYRGGNR